MNNENMEAKELLFEITEQDKTKNKRTRNRKKNYLKGPRRKLTQLTLYCGLLPFKALPLIDCNYKTLSQKLDDMRSDKENIMEKRKECGIWIVGFSGYKYESWIKQEIKDYFDEKLIKYYETIGKEDWKRAKGKITVDVKRVVRNAETVMFMDRLPIKYMIGDKPILKYEDVPVGNFYYSPRELQQSAMKATDNSQNYGHRGSRNNGVLLTKGGDYVMYNFSESILQIDSGYEIRLYNYMNNLLVDRNLLISPIILYRGNKVIENLIEPSDRRRQEWINNLEQPYNNVFALSLDETGQKMASIMCTGDWIKNLQGMLLPKNIEKVNIPYVVSDGIYKTLSGEERFLFLFCIPDIKRLRKFIAAAKSINDKEQFEIRCFDFQEEYIKSIAGKYAYINVAQFEKVYTSYNEKYYLK